MKSMKTMEKQINYKLLRGYVLLKVKTKTDSGIQLLSGAKMDVAHTVAKVADTVTSVKPGDKVVFEGNCFQWTIDDVDYYQVHESSIIGIVENDGKISQTVVVAVPMKEPTSHYNM